MYIDAVNQVMAPSSFANTCKNIQVPPKSIWLYSNIIQFYADQIQEYFTETSEKESEK